jgi:hypothetical protein
LRATGFHLIWPAVPRLAPKAQPALGKNGDPGMTRTCDLRFRKPAFIKQHQRVIQPQDVKPRSKDQGVSGPLSNLLVATKGPNWHDILPIRSQNSAATSATQNIAARPKTIQHAVYIGRERLGRYVQVGPRKYKAFDAKDQPLGNFRVRARVLAAIRKAARSART